MPERTAEASEPQPAPAGSARGLPPRQAQGRSGRRVHRPAAGHAMPFRQRGVQAPQESSPAASSGRGCDRGRARHLPSARALGNASPVREEEARCSRDHSQKKARCQRAKPLLALAGKPDLAAQCRIDQVPKVGGRETLSEERLSVRPMQAVKTDSEVRCPVWGSIPPNSRRHIAVGEVCGFFAAMLCVFCHGKHLFCNLSNTGWLALLTSPQPASALFPGSHQWSPFSSTGRWVAPSALGSLF